MTLYIFQRHRVCLTDHVDLICSLYSWWEGFGSSSLATLPLGFHCGSAGRESACNAGDLGSIPGLGRSPGEGKCYPFLYSSLENSMDTESASLILWVQSAACTAGGKVLSLLPKSLQMVTAAMKLKDTCSLEQKL